MHETLNEREFAWQDGYAAFTVSASNRDAAVRYIATQEEHQREKSFREKLIELLTLAKIEYDPKYLD